MSTTGPIGVVTRTEQVEHAPHYRTTLSGPEVSADVFLEINRSWQVLHEHMFTDLSRDGSAICHGCGARAWSEAWVAEGYMSENTHSWADLLYRAYMERQENDKAQYAALRNLAAQLNSSRVVLAAVVDEDAPAKVADNDEVVRKARATLGL